MSEPVQAAHASATRAGLWGHHMMAYVSSSMGLVGSPATPEAAAEKSCLRCMYLFRDAKLARLLTHDTHDNTVVRCRRRKPDAHPWAMHLCDNAWAFACTCLCGGELASLHQPRPEAGARMAEGHRGASLLAQQPH